VPLVDVVQKPADDIFSGMEREGVGFHPVALGFDESDDSRHQCRRLGFRRFQIAAKVLKITAARRT